MDIEAVADVQEFRPEQLPRRGEWVAWTLTAVAFAAWLILALLDRPVFLGFMLLAWVLGLSALAISLGNWMDRRTLIRLEPQGIHFENGLRNTSLLWDEVQTVEVYPSNIGDKVRVLGEKSHFTFRTLGEVHMQGELKGRMGFARGAQILEQILKKARLKETRRGGEGYYYSRK